MRTAIAVLLGASFVIGSATNAVATSNALDGGFGTGGIVLLGPTPISGILFQPRAGMAIQDDGKIVLGGRVTSADEQAPGIFAAVGRLNADGSWDAGFGDHGVFVLPYASVSAPNGGEIHEVVVMSDHSILAAGGRYASFGAGDFDTCALMIKISGTGSLDGIFGPDNSGSFCYDFAPSNGSPSVVHHYEGVLAGSGDSFYLTMPYTNLTHGAVAHFDASGAPVSGFGSNGVAALPEGVVATMLQPGVNGALLAVGGTNREIHVMRLDSSGGLDSLYGTAGSFVFDTQPVGGIVSPVQSALDAQQRLVIATNDEAGGLDVFPYRIARLTGAGAFDAAFNASGQQPGYAGFATPTVSATPEDFLWSVLPLPDGHLFAIGESGFLADGDGATNIALLRLNSDSSYDASFGAAAHAGWTSLNVYGTADSNNHTRSVVADGAGFAYATIFVNDGNAQSCAGLIRVIPDRLLDSSFDAPAAAPTCPQ